MLMFGITTFIFALGIIALVLENTLKFMIAGPYYIDQILIFTDDPSFVLVDYISFIRCYRAWATITCLMVRFHGADMSSD
jgi:hypothetical protein